MCDLVLDTAGSLHVDRINLIDSCAPWHVAVMLWVACSLL